MKLLLPMDRDDTEEGKLVSIGEAAFWAVIDVEEGELVDTEFFTDKEAAMEQWPSAIVVTGDFEPFMEFIEQQMMVLVAHTQRSIDDIVEAFLFKELHEPMF
jgi:predicted Fe-Mo cluster-binding NifX family protein